MPDYQTTQAVVLRTAEYSETSQVVTFWTQGHGKVRGIVKGARRGPKGGAGLDLLNLCEITFVPKAPPTLSLITGWQVQSAFRGLRTDLHTLYTSLYAVELLNAATDDGDPDPDLFDLFVRFLRAMEEGVRPYPALLRFEMLLLRHVGLAPHADRCAGCGAPAAEATTFSAAAGGVLCAECGARHEDAFAVSAEAVVAAERLQQAEPPTGLRWTDGLIGEIRRMLDDHMTYHLGRRLDMRKHVEPSATMRPAHAGEERKG